jgi:hypothetical protein
MVNNLYIAKGLKGNKEFLKSSPMKLRQEKIGVWEFECRGELGVG